MKEQLVSFETAKLAKEKGFELECDKRYRSDGRVAKTAFDYISFETYARVTQSLLQKWLREKHNIFVNIESGFDTFLGYNRGFKLTLNGKIIWKNNDVFVNYEKALEKGLQEALLLIKKLKKWE